MKKIIVVVLIALLVFGGILNAKVDRQVFNGVPLTEEYLHRTNCMQTVIWVIFSFISGLMLLFEPEPLATWLGKIKPKRNNRFAVRFMGFFLLACIPLSAYSLANDCQTLCNLLPR
jgi:hypothetical protein